MRRHQVRCRFSEVLITVMAFVAGVCWGMTREPVVAQQSAAVDTAMPGARTLHVFDAPVGMVFHLLVPGQGEVLEFTMERVTEALTQHPDVERRVQADGWRLFVADEAWRLPDLDVEDDTEGELEFVGLNLYVTLVDPVLPGADYSVPEILNDAFPLQSQSLYDRYVAAYQEGQVWLNLSPIVGP